MIRKIFNTARNRWEWHIVVRWWMVAIIILLLAGTLSLRRHYHTGNFYPHAGTVVAVDYAEDVVTVQDGAGNLWRFLDAEDWGVGDLCALLMDDNSTEDIRDDSILLVRYGGRAQWAY